MRIIRLALAQINTTVGDLEGNFQKINQYIDQALAAGADLVAFPEMAIPGYPAEDLLLKPEFIEDNLAYLNKLIPRSKEIFIIVGFADRQDDIFNAAALLHGGKLVGIYHKRFLPNYGVFDENRYFQEGQELLTFNYLGVQLGVNICEDIWYPGGPTRDQALYGNAEVIINISASPYAMEKAQDRQQMLCVRARDNEVVLAYVNLVGGQDELVFDGNSVVINEEGDPIAKAPAFEEHLLVADVHPDKVFNRRLHDPRRRKEKLFMPPNLCLTNLQLEGKTRPQKRPEISPAIHPFLESDAEVYQALRLGLNDYVRKNRFQKVVLGISGGIDSALVAAIAVDALGRDNVIGVSMPSEFTSEQSKKDARQLAENLGFTFYEIPITPFYQVFLRELKPHFQGRKPDVTEENIQARIRGNILMALSNKFGWLVLATGNKSEISTGYCTLYGDMVGGFSVIKDIPKLWVYRLARYRNRIAGFDLIPSSILEKPPSAELRPNQRDTDALPPYDILDPIVKAYVEEDLSFEEIVSLGFDAEVVKRVIRLVDRNEYKRRQAAPGIKVTHRAFGKDRRFPITNRYNPYDH